MVSSGSGILPDYRGVTGTPRGSNGPSWAIGEKEGEARMVVRAPQGSLNWSRGRGRGPLSSFPLPLPLLPSSPSWTRKGGGPTPTGSRIAPLGRTL